MVSRNVQSLANNNNNTNTHRIKRAWLASRTEHIILIQETWGHEVAVTGYQGFHKSRTGMRGGGVSTYLKEGLKGRIINDRIADTLIVLVENGSDNARSGLLLVNVYMPPSSVNKETRQTREDNIIREITRVKSLMDSVEIILAGDINKEAEDDYLSLKIAAPRFVTHRRGGKLDAIYESYIFSVKNCKVEGTVEDHYVVSDHFAITASIEGTMILKNKLKY